ncbi:MAG: hypothetical protein H6622_00025 [Halobacteriovoraceae bacterium]|nr:hypothetical protein [Halobacteriovoraceae bacterium]
MRSIDEFLINLYKNLNFEKSSDLYRNLDKVTESLSTFLKVDRVSVWSYFDEKEAIISQSLFTLKEGRKENGQVMRKSEFPKYFAALEKKMIIEAADACKNESTECFSEGYLRPLGIKLTINPKFSPFSG